MGWEKHLQALPRYVVGSESGLDDLHLLYERIFISGFFDIGGMCILPA